MSTSDDLARKLAGLLRGITDRLEMVGYFRQGTIAAVNPGPPRSVDVNLDDGVVPDVPLLRFHSMPAVDEACWIVRVREGGWLYGGQQGGDSGWTVPALVNGWNSYDPPFNPASYRKVGEVVYVRGLVGNGLNGTIFTLPVGYRPSGWLVFETVAVDARARVDVHPDGAVALTSAADGLAWLSLDGITFPIT